VFVSQSVDGVIYVARVPQREPFLWSAIEVASVPCRPPATTASREIASFTTVRLRERHLTRAALR
jgi:hypothetical protein